jgi:DNA-binding XRE family transcriptional regulator
MSFIMPITPIREPSAPLNLLMKVRQFFTQRVLAEKLSVTAKTISRWENRQTQMPLLVVPALRECTSSCQGQLLRVVL